MHSDMHSDMHKEAPDIESRAPSYAGVIEADEYLAIGRPANNRHLQGLIGGKSPAQAQARGGVQS